MKPTNRLGIVFLISFAVSLATAQAFTLCPEAEDGDIKVYQGLDGWLFYPGDFADSGRVKTDDYLERLNRVFEQQGIELVMLILPNRGMFHADKFDMTQEVFTSYSAEQAHQAYKDFVAELQATGVDAPDVLSPVLESEQRGAYGRTRDAHWSPTGASVVAEALAAYIKSLPVFESLTPRSFETEQVGSEPFVGGLANRAKDACPGVVIPDDEILLYETSALEQSADSSALFGDQAIDVVLLGTSYSQPGSRSHLEGFLKSKLSTDVYNGALGAGAAFGAIETFLFTPLEKPTPKLIIWEIPFNAVAGLNSEDEFRQTIPGAHGICDASESLAAETGTLTGAETVTLFEDVTSLGLQGPRYFVYLETSDTTVNKVSLTLSYADGTQEEASLGYRGQLVTGRFAYELSSEITSPLASVVVELPAGTQGTLQTRLCDAEK